MGCLPHILSLAPKEIVSLNLTHQNCRVGQIATRIQKVKRTETRSRRLAAAALHEVALIAALFIAASSHIAYALLAFELPQSR
jgi:hypothetical protein